ncbi:MAG TPA: SdrD B-like domain-containing protein [Anaerolineales bacterium]|nr:SdrD B-like domain-containing protein [Anaerolineales bacterium]
MTDWVQIRQQVRRLGVILGAALLSVSLIFGALPQPGPVQAAGPELQLTVLPLTLVFPTLTPTRTPTPINVGNFIWDDLDGDGRQDAGEPGLAGVQVQLWNAAKSTLYGATTTNASGIYTLVAPVPGDYRVRVILPAGAFFTGKDLAGGDDLLDSDINSGGLDAGFTDVYTFASNLISITSIDGGIIPFKTPTPTRTPTPINLGNFVWHDTNANGIQDAGEPGVAGVIVQLWSPTKTQLYASATTNASGIYTVVAPIPGDYRIRVIVPIGASIAPKQQGGDATKDSDINPSGSNAGFTDSFNIASNVISITSLDIGLLSVPATLVNPTMTPTPFGTPAPMNQRVYLPALTR